MTIVAASPTTGLHNSGAAFCLPDKQYSQITMRELVASRVKLMCATQKHEAW
jgi:hypothetical protein